MLEGGWDWRMHCSHKVPPAKFEKDVSMRNSENKDSLVKSVKDMTTVDSFTSIPSEGMKTAVITDAMHMIRKLSFKEGETFQGVAQRYGEYLVNAGPPRTDVLHFCCDHCYDTLSLNSVQNTKRYNIETAVEYDIDNHYPVPTPDSFFPLPENKRKLLTYLCENWSAPQSQILAPSHLFWLVGLQA